MWDYCVIKHLPVISTTMPSIYLSQTGWHVALKHEAKTISLSLESGFSIIFIIRRKAIDLQSTPVNACSIVALEGKSSHGALAVLLIVGGWPSLKLSSKIMTVRIIIWQTLKIITTNAKKTYSLYYPFWIQRLNPYMSKMWFTNYC